MSPEATGPGDHAPFDLDDTDKAIIRELQRDGRMPYTKLAPLVGLSQAATRQRVNRLLDRGIMQVVAVTDPQRVGLDVQAMVCLRVDGDLGDAAEALGAIDEVEYVVVTAGAYDLLAEVVCPDSDRLLEVLNDDIRSLPAVTDVQVLTYLDITKQTYTWGTG